MAPKEIEVLINEINSQDEKLENETQEKKSVSILDAINQQILNGSSQPPLAKFGESSDPITNNKRLFSEVFPQPDNQANKAKKVQKKQDLKKNSENNVDDQENKGKQMPKNFSKKKVMGPKPSEKNSKPDINGRKLRKKKPQVTWAKDFVRTHHVPSYKKWNKKMFEKLCANLSYFKDGPQEDLPDASGRIMDEDDDPNDEDY